MGRGRGIAEGTDQAIDVTGATGEILQRSRAGQARTIYGSAPMTAGFCAGATGRFHVNAPVNHAPVSAADFTAIHNQTISASALFTTSDADNDSIKAYRVWDSTVDPASGHWVIGGVTQDTNVAIDVSAAQSAATKFSEPDLVPDDLWVRANDWRSHGAR